MAADRTFRPEDNATAIERRSVHKHKLIGRQQHLGELFPRAELLRVALLIFPKSAMNQVKRCPPLLRSSVSLVSQAVHLLNALFVGRSNGGLGGECLGIA